MKLPTLYFNIILLTLGLAGGCQSPETAKKKELAALRLHMEATSYGVNSATDAVPIYRAHPTLVNVERAPFADERDIEHAEVVEVLGGFAIQLQFNRHGQWMLESVTRVNPNRRIAVFAQVGEEQPRWLGAPRIGQPIANGILIFTPDATREESDRIVSALNNDAAQLKKDFHFQ